MSELGRRRQIALALAKSGVTIGYSDQWNCDGGIPVDRKQHPIKRWLGEVCGDELLFEDAIYVNIGGRQVNDDNFAKIGQLKSVQVLIASGYGTSALSGEDHRSDLPELTDEGLTHIANLRELVWLDVRNSAVTDRGLMRLYRLQKLKELDVGATNVSDEGVRAISSALPLLNVEK